jgi:hypothetical protein
MVTALVLQLIQCIIKVPEAEEKRDKLKEKSAADEREQVRVLLMSGSR